MVKIRLKPLTPKQSVAFFRSKGFRVGFDYRDVWQSEHQVAFTVAKAMQLSVLRTIREMVDKSLADGITFKQFADELKPNLVKQGWWGKAEQVDPLDGKRKLVQLGSIRRLKVIYDTNLRTAHAEGQWQRIQERKETAPFLIYDANNSEVPREEHGAWDNLVLPVDHPFWAAHMPVKAFGCKCRVRQLTQRQVERRGFKVGPAPRVPKRRHVNKRTGEITQVPSGVHPAFDYPIGQRRNRFHQAFATQLDTAPQATATKAITELYKTREFKRWLEKPIGTMPVAHMDEQLQAGLSAKTPTVLMSEETMRKQLKSHPELTTAEYGLLSAVVDRGTVITQGSDRLVFFETEKRLYKAVLKTTQDRGENFVVSFQRTNPREFKRMLRQGVLVRESVIE